MSRTERYIWGVVYWVAAYTIGLGIYVQGDNGDGTFDPILLILAVGWVIYCSRVWRRNRRRIVTSLGFAVRAVVNKVRLHVGTRLVWRILRRHTTEVDVMGFTTYIDASPEERPDIPLRLAGALKILREVAPARYRRLVRLRPGFYVSTLPCSPAAYFPQAHVIGLTPNWVLKAPGGVLSGLIAHELHHAYTCALGLYARSPWVDSKLELLAIRETLRYARTLFDHNYERDGNEVAKFTPLSMDRWFWRKDGTRFRRTADGKRLELGRETRASRAQAPALTVMVGP